jgi:hypothetical protein
MGSCHPDTEMLSPSTHSLFPCLLSGYAAASCSSLMAAIKLHQVLKKYDICFNMLEGRTQALEKVGWLAGWLVVWRSWQAGWLSGWLAGWLAGWLKSGGVGAGLQPRLHQCFLTLRVHRGGPSASAFAAVVTPGLLLFFAPRPPAGSCGDRQPRAARAAGGPDASLLRLPGSEGAAPVVQVLALTWVSVAAGQQAAGRDPHGGARSCLCWPGHSLNPLNIPPCPPATRPLSAGGCSGAAR